MAMKDWLKRMGIQDASSTETITPTEQTPDTAASLGKQYLGTDWEGEKAAAEEEFRKGSMLERIGGTIGGTLTALGGQEFEAGSKAAKEKIAQEREQTVGEVEKARQRIAEKYKLAKEIEQDAKDAEGDKAKNDPDSFLSQTGRQQVLQMFPNIAEQIPGFEQMTYKQLEKVIPSLTDIYGLQQEKEKSKIEQEWREQVHSDAQENIKAQREQAAAIREEARRDRLDAESRRRTERMEREERKRVEKQAKEAQLENSQVKELVDLQDVLTAVDALTSAKKTGNFDTGPLVEKYKGWAPSLDPEYAAFRSQVEDMKAQFIKAISGATVSPSERAALEKVVPTMTDNDQVFLSKAKKFRERMERLINNRLNAYSKMGKDTSGFENITMPADGDTGGTNENMPASGNTPQDIADLVEKYSR